MNETDKMNLTIDLAEEALSKGEMPISACVFLGNRLIAKAYTSEKADGRLLVHAEMKALLLADTMCPSFEDREKAQLFTTLEPCLMCYGAAMSFYLGGIYYSLKAPKDGALSLIDFSKFTCDYVKLQNFPITGGYCVQRTKDLFATYRDIVKEGPLYSFAEQVIKGN